jgi:hypothetical protein
VLIFSKPRFFEAPANEKKRESLRTNLMETVAIGLAVASPIKVAIDAEEAFADVKKVVDTRAAGNRCIGVQACPTWSENCSVKSKTLLLAGKTSSKSRTKPLSGIRKQEAEKLPTASPSKKKKRKPDREPLPTPSPSPYQGRESRFSPP